MTYSELCAYIQKEFGESGLHRAAPQAVADILLPSRSKSYLVDVGLPSQRILELSLSLKGQQFPRLAQLAPRVSSVALYPNARSLGTNTNCAVCIDGTDAGAVFLADLADRDRARFINSNVESFGATLALYHEYCRVGPTLLSQEIDDFILNIEERMNDVDAAALQSAEHWWALVVEQMKDGLL